MRWVLMLLLLWAVPSQAALVLVGAGNRASVGDTISVPIKVAYCGNARYNALRATLNYDAEALRFIKAEVAPGFRNACGNAPFTAFSRDVGWICAQASLMGSGCTYGNGEVFRIWFVAKSAGLTELVFGDCPSEPRGGAYTGLFNEGYPVPTKTRNAVVTVLPRP